MKVLVACEESQRVCIAFRELGHEAYSCDIQECSGERPEWHILGDASELVNGNCSFTTMDGKTHNIEGKWDLLIAHPPCTYLSNAGACRLRQHGELNMDRYNKGMQAKEFFMIFFNDTATTEIYTGEDTLSLHDALPIQKFVCKILYYLQFDLQLL